MRSSAVEHSPPNLAAALAEKTALSRATSGDSTPHGAAGSAAPVRSLRQSTLALDVSDPRRAYTVNDTARILSISRSTIYKLIKLKSLKTIRLCGRRLITRASVEDLLAGGL